MNDARWPDAMAVDSLGDTGASPARAVKFKIRGFRTRSFQTVSYFRAQLEPITYDGISFVGFSLKLLIPSSVGGAER